MTRERIDKLQKEYVDISVCAAEEMGKNVTVKTLRYSLLCLPKNLKKEHRKFVRETKAEMNEAESSEDIIDVIGEHFDYLHYTLLGYVIGLYGSGDLKKRMSEYVRQVESFRKETRLEVFSEVCDDEPEKINGRFATMVTKHERDWKTATLEDVERFRIQVCRELSLYDFSLNLLKVARGCVEVTWRVPRSLVTFIQNCVKPSSQSMTDHHVTTLTIDGFIAYHNSFGIHYLTTIAVHIYSFTAKQNELKVIRLQLQAIHAHISYLIEEMSVDEVVSHLVQMRLLSEAQATDLKEMSSRQEKVAAVVDAVSAIISNVVGRLPTLCASLVCGGQAHIAERLLNSEYTISLICTVVQPLQGSSVC